MSIYVFAGPTIAAADARKILDAHYLPPASQGDVFRRKFSSCCRGFYLPGELCLCPSRLCTGIWATGNFLGRI